MFLPNPRARDCLSFENHLPAALLAAAAARSVCADVLPPVKLKVVAVSDPLGAKVAHRLGSTTPSS
eukprot:SAG11_NODE_7929_length_1080_cov_1.095821_1_plen_65_part_10